MYLKRIEMFGFKSFAEKTVLNFEPGITAVVGPNGCGKSNVFDAIRWVLGEQSMKELRGASKEDVIFNGTNTRAALNVAEVSLTFSNENKVFPIDYEEVTVSRRLFRSGESEYLLNRTQVRLKDILELFMGTGIGAEAYSLVQQGKVDLVVSARPEDRRLIFDEAAGITKYKSKKREALNRLKDTDNNLLRSNDIILEVKRQIASIERQAKKAQRYKEEFERLKVLEFMLSEKNISQFHQERQSLEKASEESQEKEKSLQAELDLLRQKLSEENNLVSELDQKANDLHQEDIKVENQIEMEARQISFNEERMSVIEQNAQRMIEQKEKLISHHQVQEQKIASLRQSLSELQQVTARNEEQLSSRRLRLTDSEEQIRHLKDAIKKEEEDIFQFSAQQVNLRNQVNEAMKEFQAALARKRRLSLETEKVQSEKEQVEFKLQGINKEIDRCLSEIGAFQQEKSLKEESLSQSREKLTQLGEAITLLENTILSLTSKREFIEEMRVQYEDTADPVSLGRLFTDHRPSAETKGMIGKIRDVNRIDEQQQDMLKTYLKEYSGDELYEIICETKFIELDPEAITTKINSLKEEVVRKNEERKILFQDISQQENYLAEISLNIHSKEKELSGFKADQNNILQEEQKLLDELSLISQEFIEAKTVLESLKTAEDELNSQLNSIGESIEVLQNTIKSQQAEIVLKTQEREGILIEMTQMETELVSCREQEHSQKEHLKMFEESLTTAQQEIHRLDRELEEGEAKKGEYLRSTDQIRIKIEELKIKKNMILESLSQYENEKQQVFGRIESLRPSLTQAQEQLENIRTQAHDQDLRKQEILFAEQSIKDKLSQAYKIDIDQVNGYLHGLGENETEVLDLSTLHPDQDSERIQEQKTRIALKEFKETLEMMRNEVSLDRLDEEVQQLKKRCDSYGAVNLVAIDEYEELKQRFEFLTSQQTDLLEAKQSLMNTITKINRTTRQIFIDTFTKVSEEFRIYFRMLFGGGEADLILVDPENVLESGIDIVAKPPGKKLQNITLLSGGEKTMAAIALIFAVFKVRPSPFCVLDEIDAALDESNVGRYSYLLQEFSKIAQFIVITHNKKTISAADVMYGVTMQERGVSSIVSVKLSAEEEEIHEQVPAAV